MQINAREKPARAFESKPLKKSLGVGKLEQLAIVVDVFIVQNATLAGKKSPFNCSFRQNCSKINKKFPEFYFDVFYFQLIILNAKWITQK